MFLPLSKQELIDNYKIDRVDFVVVTGDAYVDHPSFGSAVIARLVEHCGYSVGIVSQPQVDRDYQEFGSPNYAFLIAGGVVDSMVNNYYSSLNRRTRDEYSEGGVYGKRPDRCVDVYASNLRRLYPNVPLIAGGLEASLRRLAHYDYWSDSVRASILMTSGVDCVVYGMGERPILDLLDIIRQQGNLLQLRTSIDLEHMNNINGCVWSVDITKIPIAQVSSYITNLDIDSKVVVLPSLEAIKNSKLDYCKAFVEASNAIDNKDTILIQVQNNNKAVVVNKPTKQLSVEQMDMIYDLPYERQAHPKYLKGVPAIKEVEYSITAHRGCYGNCSFCAITYHQGRVVQNRSDDNIVDEVKRLAKTKGFKGYINDIGGPTANFHVSACDKQIKQGACVGKNCIGNKKCKNLKIDHTRYLGVLRRARAVDGVKKVFIRSGVRFDYIMEDMDRAFLNELVKYHVSGQLKVAPEHASDSVLQYMNKPPFETYLAFKKEFEKATALCGMAKQYLVPYFISGHPGCTIQDAVVLTEYLKSIGYMPLQVQDFYPTPSTLSTTMYYTELDPYSLKTLFVAKTAKQKAMQRALLQWRLPKNYALCNEAYKMVGHGQSNKKTFKTTSKNSTNKRIAKKKSGFVKSKRKLK